MAAAVTLGLFMSSPAAAAGYAALLGASAGMAHIVMGVIWAHFYGRHRLGRVQGSAVMIMISAAALGPLPLAALQAMFDSFRIAVIVMAIMPVIAIAAIVLARPNAAAFAEDARGEV